MINAWEKMAKGNVLLNAAAKENAQPLCWLKFFERKATVTRSENMDLFLVGILILYIDIKM